MGFLNQRSASWSNICLTIDLLHLLHDLAPSNTSLIHIDTKGALRVGGTDFLASHRKLKDNITAKT